MGAPTARVASRVGSPIRAADVRIRLAGRDLGEVRHERTAAGPAARGGPLGAIVTARAVDSIFGGPVVSLSMVFASHGGAR